MYHDMKSSGLMNPRKLRQTVSDSDAYVFERAKTTTHEPKKEKLKVVKILKAEQTDKQDDIKRKLTEKDGVN
jgi:hypothetical protein